MMAPRIEKNPTGTPIPMAILSDEDRPPLLSELPLPSVMTVAPVLEIIVSLLIFDRDLVDDGFNDLGKVKVT
jgi:hypothetical protein